MADSHRSTRGFGPSVAYAAFLLVVALTAYSDVLRTEFINEDYIFLDEALSRSWLQSWSRDHALFGWYRPWSRESHFWILSRALGGSAGLSHALSLALWMSVLLLFRSLAERALGSWRGAWVSASLALLSSWSVPVLWCAGVQESWLLFFSLLAVRSALLGQGLFPRLPWLLLALMSKETAVVLPVVLALVDRLVLRLTVRRAAFHLAAGALVVLGWFLIHPGARGWASAGAGFDRTAAAGGAFRVYGQSLLSLANLERWPAPDSLGMSFAFRAIGVSLAIALLLGLAWRAARREDPALPRVRRPNWILAGALWAAAAWLPPALVGSGWHAYYSLFGSMGAWMALGAWAPVRRAAAAVPAGLGVLLLLQGQTPSEDWSSPRYLRRASAFQKIARAGLKSAHPTLAPNTRLYFLNVPSHVGFISGTGPALRTWYRDRTLSASFLSDFARRSPDSPSGPDLFFRFDSLGRWVEIIRGAENVDAARLGNPRWQRDHEALAAAFAKAGDLNGAVEEYARLVEAYPESADLAFNLGVCLYGAGDTRAARRWIEHAARMPSSTEEIREGARMLEAEAGNWSP